MKPLDLVGGGYVGTWGGLKSLGKSDLWRDSKNPLCDKGCQKKTKASMYGVLFFSDVRYSRY